MDEMDEHDDEADKDGNDEDDFAAHIVAGIAVAACVCPSWDADLAAFAATDRQQGERRQMSSKKECSPRKMLPALSQQHQQLPYHCQQIHSDCFPSVVVFLVLPDSVVAVVVACLGSVRSLASERATSAEQSSQ